MRLDHYRGRSAGRASGLSSSTTRTIRVPSQLTSHKIRDGLTESLRPLRQRLSLAKRGRENNKTTPLSNLFHAEATSPGEYKPYSFPEPNYAIGLQPHLDFPGRAQISLGAGLLSRSSLPFYYAATLAPPTGAAATTAGMSFFKFLLVFTAGGLFFSTAIAAATACYAVGMDNVRRIWELVTVILHKVWITFSLGIRATKLALLGQDETFIKREATEDSTKTKKSSWKWRTAWAVLKEQLGETRRTAAQGVQALRQEAKLYTAAVGQPGLIPLQYVVDRLMPMSLSTIMEDSIRTSLADFPKQKTIKKMTLSSFSAGTRAPVLEAARVYDVENSMAFDCTVKWDSQLDASVLIYTVGGLARVPVSLKNMKFEGTVRIVLAPLTKTAPGYGAILISLVKPPKINLDIRVLGGELTKLPFLRYEITMAMQKAISDTLLWPRRTVIPTMIDGTKRPILSAKQLAALEKTDPLLDAERALAEDPMLRSMHDTTAPMKGKGRMFRLNELNGTDTTSALEMETKTITAVKYHHDVERGVVWGGLQRLFAGYQADESTQEDTSNIKWSNTTLAVA